MLKHFLEDYSQADDKGRGGNLTELEQLYHQLWLRMGAFQCRNRRLHGAVVGFRSVLNGCVGELLRPLRPVARLRDVQFLQYVPIPQDCIPAKRGRAHRQNYRENFQISGPLCDNGDVWFSNRNSAAHRVIQHDASLQPRQDHPACMNRYFGHRASAGIGDQIQEARAGNELNEGAIIAPLSGKFAVQHDDLWYHILINGKSVFRVPKQDKDAFVFNAEGQENPELVALINQGYVRKGDVITRLSKPVEYLAAVIENGVPKTVFIGGDPPAASRNLDRLSFMVAAKERVLEYSEMIGSRGQIPEVTNIPMEYRFPRLLLELPLTLVANRRSEAVGWYPNGAFKELLLAEINTRQYESDLNLGVDYPYTSYETLTKRLDPEALRHVEDMVFDSLVVMNGMKGWIGEGICVDSRIVGEALRPHVMDRWLDFSDMAEFYVGEVQQTGDDYVSGMYLPPAFQLDLTKGLTRKVHDVTYDFQPYGPRFDKLGQRLQQRVAVTERSTDPERPRRRRRRRNQAPQPAAATVPQSESPAEQS